MKRRFRRKLVSGVLAVVVAVSLSLPVFGDLPGVEYVFPAGGQRGTTVDFHVGGYNLHDACGFEMFGEGVAATDKLVPAERTVWFEGPLIRLPASQGKEDYPKDYLGSVQIAANASCDWRRWRVWTSQGATSSRLFVVGDLPEIIEAEIDGRPIPTPVSLPVTINGRIFPREDVDIWAFEGRRGESYSCEVVASRIGSPLDSRIVINGPGGDTVAENIDRFGNDSFVSFTAPEDGVYSVQIHDIRFAGLQHYVYRLTIRVGPHVEHVYPLGGRRGTVVPFDLRGAGISDPSVLLALPQTPADQFAEQIILGGRSTNRFLLELSDLPEIVEQESNGNDKEVLLASIPGVWNGCISSPGDVDSWQIELGKDQAVELDLRAARLGSRLAGSLSVMNASGEELASTEEAPDVRLTFTAPAEDVYRIAVRERFANRGGQDFAYRLYAKAPRAKEADYQLSFEQDALTLVRGGEAKLNVQALRTGGMNAPIQLSVDGLPEGVTVSGNTIPEDQSELDLTFQATDDAPIQTAHLKLTGEATWGEATMLRSVVKSAASHQDLQVDNVLLAVSLATPFKVVSEFESRYAGRGSTHIRHYQIERGDFKGPLTIRLGDRQARHLQGVTGPTIVVPAGADEFEYPIRLPPWMEIGRTSRTIVMAVGMLQEPDGSLHQVSYTSEVQHDQIIVLVDPGQLGMQLAPRSILVGGTGESPQLRASIRRGQGISGPVTVELIVPEHIQGISAAPLELGDSETEGRLSIELADGPRGPWNMPLTVRATALVDGHPYVAEEQVDFVTQADVALRD